MKVLNVGGGINRDLPDCFAGWDQVLLDIDPGVNPDIMLDALQMQTLPADEYDGVLCRHGIEHYYQHEAPELLKGLMHVLKPGGIVFLELPHILGLFEALKVTNLDLDDPWYRTSARVPITFHDVLYGWGHALSAGNQYYAHKSAYTPTMLVRLMANAGFKELLISAGNSNLYGRGVK